MDKPGPTCTVVVTAVAIDQELFLLVDVEQRKPRYTGAYGFCAALGFTRVVMRLLSLSLSSELSFEFLTSLTSNTNLS